MPILPPQLQNIIEAALLVAGRPMSMAQLESVFEHEDEKPTRPELQEALQSLQQSYEDRGIELVEVASGWRLQSRKELNSWIANLFQEKSPRYSRALLETLVLVAYRQPITRGEIEEVRGVAVSTNIIKTLLEREWVKVVGHRDVPGRPALYATTRQFLDYFGLKKIGDLPTLSEIKALDEIAPELAEELSMIDSTGDGDSASNPDWGDIPAASSGEPAADAEPEQTVPQQSRPDEAELNPLQENAADVELDAVPEQVETAVTDQQDVALSAAIDTDVVDVELAVEEPVPADDDIQAENMLQSDAEQEYADEDESASDELDIRDATVDALSGESRRDAETLH